MLTDISGLDDIASPYNVMLNKMVWTLYVGNYEDNRTDQPYSGWIAKSPRKASENDPPFKLPIRTFPKLGIYSSSDESVIDSHMLLMRNSLIDSVIFIWDGHHNNSQKEEKTLDLLFKYAGIYGMRVGIQLRTTSETTNQTIYDSIKYYIDKYGQSQTMLKIFSRPVVILYEPYKISNIYKLISNLRNSAYDCYFVSTIENIYQVGIQNEEGFNSVFTYSVNGAYSTGKPENWKSLSKACRERGITLMLAVGPGYDDQLSNDWHHSYNIHRKNGSHYQEMWQKATEIDPDVIIINSFNNFLEGTNIEPAVPRKDYEFNQKYWVDAYDPGYYVRRTLEYAAAYKYE